jgi:hypothetical protein
MRSPGRVALAVGAVVCLTAGTARAQSTATTTETKKFQVLAVEGNDLVVRLPEGTRQLTVPADFKFTVNGKQLSVQELKPGMSGTATITTTTTTTPVTVTEVKNGTVHQVTGSTIIVRTDQGFRSFTQGDIDKRGVKIYQGGKPVELSQLHSGDKLSATIVTTMPPKIVTEKEVNATLAAAPAASRPTGTASAPAAPAAPAAAPAGAPADAGAAPARKLPKTAGPLPLIGLLGLTSLTIGAALTARRRRRAR